MINNNAKINIQERTEDFAIRVIQAYCELNKRHFDDAGKVLSKQLKIVNAQLLKQVLKRLDQAWKDFFKI